MRAESRCLYALTTRLSTCCLVALFLAAPGPMPRRSRLPADGGVRFVAGVLSTDAISLAATTKALAPIVGVKV